MNTKDKLEMINNNLEHLKARKLLQEQINNLFEIIRILEKRIDIASSRINIANERIDSSISKMNKLERNDSKNTELVEEFVNHNFKQNA